MIRADHPVVLGEQERSPLSVSNPRGFAPTDISGLAAWFRADLLVLNDNDPISTWADVSGQGNTLTGAGVARPLYKAAIINGLPVARFDGTDDLLSKASPVGVPNGSGPLSIFDVSSRGASVVQRSIIGRSTGATGWNLQHGDGANAQAIRLTTPSVIDYDAGNAWPAASTFYSHSTVLDASADCSFWRNGVFLGTEAHTVFGNATTADLIMGTGGASTWDGDVAELLVYNAELSVGARQAVEAYLMRKYGLSG